MDRLRMRGHIPSVYRPPDSVVIFLSMILGINPYYRINSFSLNALQGMKM